MNCLLTVTSALYQDVATFPLLTIKSRPQCTRSLNVCAMTIPRIHTVPAYGLCCQELKRSTRTAPWTSQRSFLLLRLPSIMGKLMLSTWYQEKHSYLITPNIHALNGTRKAIKTAVHKHKLLYNITQERSGAKETNLS